MTPFVKFLIYDGHSANSTRACLFDRILADFLLLFVCLSMFIILFMGKWRVIALNAVYTYV